jgi:hypothetical protein
VEVCDQEQQEILVTELREETVSTSAKLVAARPPSA